MKMTNGNSETGSGTNCCVKGAAAFKRKNGA